MKWSVAAVMGALACTTAASATAHLEPAFISTTPSWTETAPFDFWTKRDDLESSPWRLSEVIASDDDGLALCDPFVDGRPRLTLFDEALFAELPSVAIVPAWHVDEQQRHIDYDQIPLRWDRPEDYDAYRYPVADSRVLSGYDLDLPGPLQRRATNGVIGHGGVDLPQLLDAKVTMVALSHQIGEAEVVYVGPWFGNTVVTKHTLREAGSRGYYVVIFGHLHEPAPRLAIGSKLREGALVGFVGDSGSPDLVHLHLEVRRVRDELPGETLSPIQILSREATIVTDPRNVLPLRAKRNPTCRERIRASKRTQLLHEWGLDLPPLTLGSFEPRPF